MEISTHSVSEYKNPDSKGKRQEVSTGENGFEVQAKFGLVWIRAKSHRYTNSGNRGGEADKINTSGCVRFSQEEVQKIFEDLLKKGVVKVPGMEQLLAASKLLDEGLRAAQGSSRSIRGKRVG